MRTTRTMTATPRQRRCRAALAALLCGALVAAACGDDDEGATTTTTPVERADDGDSPDEGDSGDDEGGDAGEGEPAGPAPAGELGEVELGLEVVAELEEPTGMAVRPGTRDLYVTERGGTVRRIAVEEDERTGAVRHQVQPRPVVDLSGETVTGFTEQGLLGIAFSSDGRDLYLHHSAVPDGDTRLVVYRVGDDGAAQQGSERELLRLAQPHANHNGGQLALGPDGYLYVALGDGGGSGDPEGNGQDPTTPLGAILRIDAQTGDFEGREYSIPPDNPFADGEDGAPEVWLYGVRNPWRFSFDPETGDLWVADVGQDAWEEVNHLPAEGGVGAGRGANLGWPLLEGTHPYDGENPPGGVLPVHEYPNDDVSCSVTGGHVYRGSAIEALRGSYVFADFCAPGIRAIRVEDGSVVAERTWDLPEAVAVAAFGQGADRELYVLSLTGPVWRLTAG